MERCTIRDCGQAANPKGSQGGIGGLVFLECDKCVAQFNECHHMVTTIGCDGCAFDIDGGCTHCILQYNYSHDNEGSGFQSGPFAGCSPLGDNTIRYNISENDAKKNTGQYRRDHDLGLPAPRPDLQQHRLRRQGAEEQSRRLSRR